MGLKKKEEKTGLKSISQSKKTETARSGAPLLEALIKSLSSEDDGVRVKARHSLVAMGKAAVPPLTEALKERRCTC